MGLFKAGFSRIDITPPLGVGMSGYFHERTSIDILDPLYASCLAVNDGEHTALLMSLDIIGISQIQCDIYRNAIAAQTGVPYEGILLACTHTHTGPVVGPDVLLEDDPAYTQLLGKKLCDAARLAIADLDVAETFFGRGIAPNIAFVRRYLMKDGTTATNPGFDTSAIDHAIGTPDETVQVLSFKRETKPEILIVNFQVHPDTIGGCKFSADFPGFVRSTVETVLPNVQCIYFNGAQGDTNHLNFFGDPADYRSNNPRRIAQHMGRTIAGGVLQTYTMLKPIEAGTVRYTQKNTMVPANCPTPEQIPEAERIISIYFSDRINELPSGMLRNTLISEALRMKKFENGPDALELYTTAISFGDIAFVGFPGEPFTDMGRSAKERSPFALTIPCCAANGYEDYFPMQAAYDEGGYEARSSWFRPGVAEMLIDAAAEALTTLKNQK